MKISDRAEAARSVYQDALQTHKGFMKGLRAWSSAAKCFFSTRAVRSWQEKNMPTVSRASTGQETEGSGDTTIRERTVAPLVAADKVESDIAKPENTVDQTVAPSVAADKVESDIAPPKNTEGPTVAPSGAADKVESDVAPPKNTEGQTVAPSVAADKVESDVAPAKNTDDQTGSTDDKFPKKQELLDNSIAKSKRSARPQGRRPPTRNPNRQ